MPCMGVHWSTKARNVEAVGHGRFAALNAKKRDIELDMEKSESVARKGGLVRYKVGFEEGISGNIDMYEWD